MFFQQLYQVIQPFSAGIVLSLIHILIKEYEEQLKKERDYYNKLYQNVVCGIVQYEIEDNTLRCYNANSEALQMLGYESMEEFRRQTAQTLPEMCIRDSVKGVIKVC